MAKLKLGPIEDEKPVKLSIELPPTLYRDLVAYGEALGRESGSAPVEAAKLVCPMLNRFIATDREFIRSRRKDSSS